MIVRRTLLLLSLLGACVSPGTPAPKPVAPASGRLDTLAAIRWARASAEHEALYRETYRAAATELDRMLAANPPAKKWGVILDADETILDNSAYEQQQAALGESFDAASWDAWVAREASPALPGAVEFTRHVRASGGRVVIVTNRTEAQCAHTRGNLDKIGVPVDTVLCAPPSSGDKNPRFDAVQSGANATQVEMWLGDNIQDFPRLSQSVRQGGDSAFANFGHRFFLLPNPMYGSWSSAPLP